MKHCQRHTGLKKAMNKVTLTFDQIANCEKLLLSCQHPLNGKNLLSSFWQVPLCASQKKLEECSPFLSYCCGFTQPLHRSDRNWKIHTFHHWQIAHTHSTATLLLLATTSLSYQILISNQHTRHHRIYCLSFFIFSLLFCRLIIHLLIFEYFWTTRSCAALWAADLDWIIGSGYSLGGYILEKNHEKPTCLFFVTYAGSQLTFMTQNEKVHIFRYLRGVTTDLLDV